MSSMAPTHDHLAPLRQRLLQHPEVLVAYLFGSTARDDPSARDVDVAVVFGASTDPFRAVLALQQDLEVSTGLPVDVHDLDELPVDLQFRVIDEGSPILVRDDAARVRREVRVMQDYYDFRPYLDRIREGVRARLATDAPRG